MKKIAVILTLILTLNLGISFDSPTNAQDFVEATEKVAKTEGKFLRAIRSKTILT